MDENTIRSSLDLYNTQLEQVEQAILAAGENEDLVKLRDDLKELIELTTDSLLSLKKGLLLQSLESTTGTGNQPSSSGDGAEDEYAAFQAALGEHVTNNDDNSTNHNTSINDSANEMESMSTNEKLDETLSGLEGMRCRAPFQQDWGCLVNSNALILSVNPMLDDTETPSVKVMFCNPTHNSMLPCQFYLEDRCKYTDDECRNSHGYTVKLEDLQEYQEPDYSNIKIESKVLGLYEDDGLWYRSTVVDNIKENGDVQVIFDDYDETATLKLSQILPLDHDESSSSEESDNEEDYLPLDKSDTEDEDCLPVFLWKPPKTTARLGEWEDHTRGIGSKLMSKMGYIVGQGLGRYGQGKADPVPIQLIPKGKSLDKIMELKEQAGDQDLFDVMKKTKKKKIKKTGNPSHSVKPVKSTDVFDFINKKLRGKKGNLHELRKHPTGGQSSKPPSKKHITEQDLHSKSDRHLNIQLLKTDEELKNVEKELKRLKVSLVRNQNKDRGAAIKIQAKITSLEDYKRKLETSEKTLSRHRQRRTDHKKLTVF